MSMAEEIKRSEKVDSLFGHLNAGMSHAMVVGVVHKGKVVHRRGYGFASREHVVFATPATAFRVGSISKQFTCAGILLLADEGKLSLDDDVRRHLPDMAGLPAAVRLRDMMHNCSSIPDFNDLLLLGGARFDNKVPTALVHSISQSQRHLNAPPNTSYLYSNTNFLLLGLIIERLSGLDLGEFFDTRIFAPLGMRNTRLRRRMSTLVPNLATPYLHDPDAGYRTEWDGMPHGGEAGIVSTLDDLLIWDVNFATDRLPGGSIAERLQTVGRLSNGANSPYGFGLMFGRYRGQRTVSHIGYVLGHHTQFLRFPDAGLTVICLSNFEGSGPSSGNIVDHSLKIAEVWLSDLLDPRSAFPGEARILAGQYLNRETGMILTLKVIAHPLTLAGPRIGFAG